MHNPICIAKTRQFKPFVDVQVSPSQRLAFLDSQLGIHDAVRLIVSEAADAKASNPKGPFAHCLTVERLGKGFRVQDIAVDSDGVVTVGEHFVTRRGRYVESPGSSGVTRTDNLGSVMADQKPRAQKPQERYRDCSPDALLDRLAVMPEMTNDVRSQVSGQKIDVHKKDFDNHIRRACQTLSQAETEELARNNRLPHPLKNITDMLLPLAKSRGAQVQLSKTLSETGLAGFSLSGNDMM